MKRQPLDGFEWGSEIITRISEGRMYRDPRMDIENTYNGILLCLEKAGNFAVFDDMGLYAK